MTSRQLYEATLIELRKENAPNIMLEDYNYFVNKAINQYINKRYNIYDVNQQTTDDLRVLKASAILEDVHLCDQYNDLTQTENNATYEVILPSDYLHILNCICIYNVKKTFKCYDKGKYWRVAATRLTADAYSLVLDNFWNKPSYKRPYYYIHNVNSSQEVPTNPYQYENGLGTDYPNVAYIDACFITAKGFDNNTPTGGDNGDIYLNENPIAQDIGWIKLDGSWVAITRTTEIIYGKVGDTNYKLDNSEWKDNQNLYKIVPHPNSDDVTNLAHYAASILTDGKTISGTDYWGNPIVDNSEINIFTLQSGTSNIERSAGTRYGNASQVRMEIRYGTDNSIFELKKVYIDYIKAPQNIRLTQEQLDYTEDHSLVLEWPDYICQEIINELVHIIMENISDLRILTHPIVTLSIANPAQQLTPQE